MAEGPSPIASSLAGAPLQARDAVEAAEARRAGQHHAIRQQVRLATEAGDTVETTDADSRVFGDTEGTGSQGREPGEHEEEQKKDQEPPLPGIIKDMKGQLHLDLQA